MVNHKCVDDNRTFQNDLQGRSFGQSLGSCIQCSYQHSAAANGQDLVPWCSYLLRPKELIHLMKRYHVAGDMCIISIFSHLLITIYLWIKAVFHAIYTKTDKETAEFFASHYFPRLFESYPKQYELYGTIGAQCSYILILRLYVITRLIKRSIINRNGYREVEMSQLNGVFIESLRWPLKDWFRICLLGFRHYNRCKLEPHALDNKVTRKRGVCSIDTGSKEKEAHLYSKSWDWNRIIGSAQTCFLCEANPIDFSPCYRYNGLKLDNGHRTRLHYPDDNCRLDIWELSWLVILTLYAVPVILSYLTIAGFMSLMAELAVLSPNKFRSTILECLQQIPNLFTNANHLMRLIDSYLFFWMLSHHIFEQAPIHVDICALLSRIRKLSERFQADLLMDVSITTRIQASGDITNDRGSRAERKFLNESLKTSIFLAKTVNDEFKMLKKSTTNFLNLLTLGGGLCLAATGSIIFVAESRMTQFVVLICFTYSVLSIVLSAILCMAVEIRVSIPMSFHT